LGILYRDFKSLGGQTRGLECFREFKSAWGSFAMAWGAWKSFEGACWAWGSSNKARIGLWVHSVDLMAWGSSLSTWGGRRDFIAALGKLESIYLASGGLAEAYK
jgi:hypothetical protein